jgi:hypothetical protein
MLRALVAAVLFALAAATPARAMSVDAESFNGTWQGKIDFDKEAFLAETSTPAAGQVFRIVIHDEIVHVYIKEKDAFEEAFEGMFHLARVSANAVIYATQTLPDAPVPWVETWVFVVTQKDANALIVQYVRLVNEVDAPPLSIPQSKFAARGAGEFKRQPD